MGPTRPMSKESSHHPQLDLSLPNRNLIPGQEIQNDVVVIPRVKGNVIGPASFGDGPHDVQSLITIKCGDLNGNDVRNFREPAPEVHGQDSASDGRLQVKPEKGDLAS